MSRAENVSGTGTWRTILIPDMNFTCNGTIKAVTVIALTGKGRGMADSENGPKLQIWSTRKKNGGSYLYQKIIMLNLSTCINLNNVTDEVWVSEKASVFMCLS